MHQADPNLATLIQWAEARPAIRAMLLTSTRAVPGAPTDVLSDYDVILIVEDIQPFVADKSWLADFGDVLVVYWDPIYADPNTGCQMCGNVTQYVDGLKIDFTLWPLELFQKIVAAPSLSAELDAGYQILLDKDQLAAAMPKPSLRGYRPTLPDAALYQLQINDFLSDAPYVAKCIWRNELFPAKWCLDTDMKYLYLRQMLEWRALLSHGEAIRVGALGKGLKKYTPAALWEALEQSYVGAASEENWQALESIMAIFRQAAIDVGTQLGYAYPEELHERVLNYVRQIKALTRPEL